MFLKKNTKGTYCLVFSIDDVSLKVRSGKKFFLKKGTYLYVGSAFGSGGLKKRIQRHLKKDKKKHWHFDFVSAQDSFKALEVWIVENKRLECLLADFISKTEEPVFGFGSSDCKCLSHLFRVSDLEDLKSQVLKEFNVKIFKI
ncbi:MAG: GIY-YIG nuclease family protein [Desulfurobacteriaceae bacterium]